MDVKEMTGADIVGKGTESRTGEDRKVEGIGNVAKQCCSSVAKRTCCEAVLLQLLLVRADCLSHSVDLCLGFGGS